MTLRIQCLPLLVMIVISLPSPCLGDSAVQDCEPGLTSRVALLALARLPEIGRLSLNGEQWQLIERLQTLPSIPADDPEAQLKMIYSQVKDNVASPDLLAAAARAVVRPSLGDGTEEGEWLRFREALALRTVLSDVDTRAVPQAADAGQFAADLRTQGGALRTSALTGQSPALELRKQAASLATRGVLAVWLHLLSSQAPRPTAEAAQPDVAEVSPAIDSGVISSTPESAVVGAPAGGYIGHKVSKKFHLPNCRMLPGPQNQVALRSRAEAIRNGYSPCRICKP